MLPYIFDINKSEVPFSERKLLVAIYSNKKSNKKNELYSLRRKIIDYFEDKEGVFDLYGWGWENEKLINYKGCVKSKNEIYHGYRFALALENIGHTKDAVSEKIYDCISAGVVPIYYGDENITNYVPVNVFINLEDYGSIDELFEYIRNMDKKTYEGYLNAAENFLHSDNLKKIGIEGFCEQFYDLVTQNEGRNLIDSNFRLIYYQLFEIENRIKCKIGSIRRRIEKKFV